MFAGSPKPNRASGLTVPSALRQIGEGFLE